MVSVNAETRHYPEGIKTVTESAHVEIAQRKLEYDRKKKKKERDQEHQNHMDAFDKVFLLCRCTTNLDLLNGKHVYEKRLKLQD